jgi:hypothetical protein
MITNRRALLPSCRHSCNKYRVDRGARLATNAAFIPVSAAAPRERGLTSVFIGQSRQHALCDWWSFRGGSWWDCISGPVHRAQICPPTERRYYRRVQTQTFDMALSRKRITVPFKVI